MIADAPRPVDRALISISRYRSAQPDHLLTSATQAPTGYVSEGLAFRNYASPGFATSIQLNGCVTASGAHFASVDPACEGAGVDATAELGLVS